MNEPKEAKVNKSWPTGTTEAECERLIERALLHDPTVKFMVDKLEEVRSCTPLGVRFSCCLIYYLVRLWTQQRSLHLSCKRAGGLQREQEFLSCGVLRRRGWRRLQATRWGALLAESIICTSLTCSRWLQTSCCERENVLVATSLAGVAQVVICHNRLCSQEEVSQALTHELIHAYDHCRSRNLDWSNCEHHACSEARSLLQSSLLSIMWLLERDPPGAGATPPALYIWRKTEYHLAASSCAVVACDLAPHLFFAFDNTHTCCRPAALSRPRLSLPLHQATKNFPDTSSVLLRAEQRASATVKSYSYPAAQPAPARLSCAYFHAYSCCGVRRCARPA